MIMVVQPPRRCVCYRPTVIHTNPRRAAHVIYSWHERLISWQARCCCLGTWSFLKVTQFDEFLRIEPQRIEYKTECRGVSALGMLVQDCAQSGHSIASQRQRLIESSLLFDHGRLKSIHRTASRWGNRVSRRMSHGRSCPLITLKTTRTDC
ncbi:hypothetical protein BDV19DRAFT_245328 [Aspergillus venezuelensis]